MATLKEVQSNLENVLTIGTITGIYQDMAQLRMNRVREEVLKTRQFLEGLIKVYGLAKKSYLASAQKKDSRKLAKLLTKGKKDQVLIFLSTNEFFHGHLISELWRSARNYLKENKANLVVIGKMGKYLAEQSGYGHKLFYFQLDDEKPAQEDLKELVESIRKYERVIVFHGRFETVIHQEPMQTDISGGNYLEEETIETKRYLFEPSPEEILEFFENEIVAALFNQVILEHRLAKHASRMVAMHQITEKANLMGENLKKKKMKILRQIQDKKQIEFFNSFNI